MADLRLIAVLAAACTNAEAQPTKAPAGWAAQPAIVTAAKQALGKQTIDGIEAFGDPAKGCYSVWMAMRGSGSAKDLAGQIVKGLAGGKVEIKDVVTPTSEDGVLSLAFVAAPNKGRLRARLGKGKLVALACWSVEREPAACEQACTSVLGGLP